MASEFTGVCICLFLPPSAAEKLALHGGEHPDDLHITLGYFGDSSSLSDDQIISLRQATRLLADCVAPVTARVSGLGMFNAPKGEKMPVYASVDSKDVYDLHSSLYWALENMHAPRPFETYSYTPHITLDYAGEGEAFFNPSDLLLSLEIHFDSITLAIGPNRESFVFKGPLPDSLQ